MIIIILIAGIQSIRVIKLRKDLELANQSFKKLSVNSNQIFRIIEDVSKYEKKFTGSDDTEKETHKS